MIPFDPINHPDTDPPPTPGQRVAAWISLLLLAVLTIAFLVFAAIHAARAADPPAETIPAPTSSWYLPDPVVTTPPAVTINGAATAHESARRVSIPTTATTTTVAFDCQGYVDGLAYEWLNLAPVHDAYRVTAQCLGWPLASVDRWESFVVDDVIANESGGCWNIRRGAIVGTWLGCVLDRQGTREDSGFGQLIGVWWHGPGTPVCDRLGLCTSAAVVASPWNSMRALLVAVETDGKGPWCYDTRARRLHSLCGTVARSWP